MFTERKFYGPVPAWFVYFTTISLWLFASLVTLFALILKFYLLLVFFLPVLALIFWLIKRNRISWVHFKKENVTVRYIYGFEEEVLYENLQKFSVKMEGLNAKSLCSIEFIGRNKARRTVNFLSKGLDHQQFRADLIELKKQAQY